jgi:hypothetical protein
MVPNERRTQIQKLSELYAELLHLRQEVREAEARPGAVSSITRRTSPIEVLNRVRKNLMLHGRSNKGAKMATKKKVIRRAWTKDDPRTLKSMAKDTFADKVSAFVLQTTAETITLKSRGAFAQRARAGAREK